ncbi:CRISPR-associated helicase Cas3' [Desulforudis sp. 1088]|uniref:CRISPR-associated helicase Cas3' n=1 Tax=unclassified Candidatus Desulforudis TaxID=2635950 RepID=UPI003CE46938
MTLLDELNQLFRELMFDSTLALYDFQLQTAMELLDGRSVILRAPTGGGKTWAALLPFLYARHVGEPISDRVLYALPLRSLASQLHASTLASCSNAGWSVSDEPGEKKTGRLEITLQTGERQNDPFFLGDIVFTTIDQLLSSYLLTPVSLNPRLANMNAGALVGSLVVFDEFHLLDPERSMTTAIEMLDRLQDYCRFVLMTATLSDEAVKWLAQRLNAAVVEPSDAEIAQIDSRKKRGATQRMWLVEYEPLTAARVISDHLAGGHRRTLVLTNTVSRAQDFYKELLRVKPPDVSVCLLHSRFFREDRAGKEEQVIARLGKQSQDLPENFILVSTQVVEAGMDFSVDCLHTELAPANSLIQRAGRCARYGGKGTVRVYPVDNPAPYPAMEVKRTLDVLTPLSGELFSAVTERNVVNSVHGPFESEVLRRFNLRSWRKDVNLAMDGFLPDAPERLIRDVNTVNILITSDPEAIRFDLPDRWPEMLSVPAATLHSFLRCVELKGTDVWVVAVPTELDGDSDNEGGLRFRWKRFTMAPPIVWLVVINPVYARYTSDLGLRLGEAGQEIPFHYIPRNSQQRYRYHCETMVQHVQTVLKEMEELSAKCTCAQQFLVRVLGVRQETIKIAERLGIIFHDVGKLSEEWQQAVRAWQKFKTGRLPDKPLAHSDYDPEKDWHELCRFPKRPNHALEGAYACCDYLFKLFQECNEVAACVVTAIARHHTGHAKTLGRFKLIPEAASTINDLLAASQLPQVEGLRDRPTDIALGKGGEFSRELLMASREEDQDWLPLYWYIVRLLRLADQAGSAKGGRE